MQSSTPPPATDQLITMRMSWAEFESFLQIRGESVSPRITYLDGVLARAPFPTPITRARSRTWSQSTAATDRQRRSHAIRSRTTLRAAGMNSFPFTVGSSFATSFRSGVRR